MSQGSNRDTAPHQSFGTPSGAAPDANPEPTHNLPPIDPVSEQSEDGGSASEAKSSDSPNWVLRPLTSR